MSDLSRRTLLHRTARAAVAVTGTSALMLATSCTDDPDSGDEATDGSDGSAEGDEAAGEGTESLRAAFHLTPDSGWMGDPQRPVLLDGVHHLYWLHHEGDEPGPTAWAHSSTHDLVAFEHHGAALAAEEGFDVWTGSAVVDAADTAGLGAGTVIALATRPTDGESTLQEQYLHHSADGSRFTLEPEPVIPNPDGRFARSDAEIADAEWFRDPKVESDPARQEWVCAIGRDHRVAFLTSPDLHTWEEREDFAYRSDPEAVADLGGVECPDLFSLTADDGTDHWVLGASMDGHGAGEPINYAYWIGEWDGERFLPDSPEPHWLDRGWDWYAGVTWPSREDPRGVRLAIAWMNNWTYAAQGSPTLASDGYDGQCSLVRELRLTRQSDGGYMLLSTPVPALSDSAQAVHELADLDVEGTVQVPWSGRVYELEIDLAWEDATNVGVSVLRSADGARGTTIGHTAQSLYVDRSASGSEEFPFAELTQAEAPTDPETRAMHLRIFVDTQSVEVFADDGRSVLSQKVHPAHGEEGIALYAEGGAARATGIVIREH